MGQIRWSDADVALAVEVLGRNGTVLAALDELGSLGVRMPYRTLVQRLQELGLGTPKALLRRHEEPAPESPLPPRKARTEANVAAHEPLPRFGLDRPDAPGNEEWDDLAERRGERARNAYVGKLERRIGDRDYIGRRIGEAITAAFEYAPLRLTYDGGAPQRTGKCERLLTVMLSDLHWGLHVDPREIRRNAYDWTIAARRLAKVVEQVATWKPEHRAETELQIALLGDILAGIIHTDDAGLRTLTEQVHGATWLLVAAIDYLRHHGFRRIRVLCLPGNHDRVTVTRAVSQRWNAYSSHVYMAVAAAFRGAEDVSFEVPLTGDGTYPLPGRCGLVYCGHGDTAPLIANPGKSLNTGKLSAEFAHLVASREFSAPIRVWLAGHWHQPVVMHFATGALVVNGSMIGADGFAVHGAGVRGGGNPAQVMFESTPDYPLGDTRILTLSDADRVARYDRIIAAPELNLARVA